MFIATGILLSTYATCTTRAAHIYVEDRHRARGLFCNVHSVITRKGTNTQYIHTTEKKQVQKEINKKEMHHDNGCHKRKKMGGSMALGSTERFQFLLLLSLKGGENDGV